MPFLPEQVIDKRATPSMNLNDIVKALTLAIEAVLKTKKT